MKFFGADLLKSLAKSIMRFLKSELFRSLLSGLIPSLLLIVFLWSELKQTREQIDILQEQISYARKPVLLFNKTLAFQRVDGDFDYKLSIANVGNETAENVLVRFHLFLVTDDKVYSYGQYEKPEGHWADTTRTPRRKLWPRLTLEPNSEEKRIHKNLIHACRTAFLEPEAEDDFREELSTIQDIFKGEYVLFAEYSYRRQSDFVLCADTAYYHLAPYSGPFEDLRNEIGGPRIIERVKTYLQDGPENFIAIMRDHYTVYELTYGRFMLNVTKTRTFPRTNR